MTLLEIEQDICRRLDKNATNLDPETKARIDTFINDRYRELMRLDGIDLRDESLQLVTTPQRERYALAPTVTQIVAITNRTTGARLQQTTLSRLRSWDAANGMAGSPTHYVVVNEAGIEQQPSVFTPGALEALNVNSVDTRTLTVEFQEATTGSFQTRDIQLAGTTPVPIPPAVGRLFRIYTDAVGNTPVIVREVVSQRVLAQLPTKGTSGSGLPTEFVTHQWVVLFWPTPSGAYTLTIDFARPRRALVSPTDEPALPEEFHTLLVWGGCEEECLKMDDNRSEYYARKWFTDVARLRAFLHHARGERWIPGRRGRGHSDLGGNYPAGY